MDHLDAAVGSALATWAMDVHSDRPGEWRIDLGNGVPHPARARLRDQWLELTAPIAPESYDGGPWTALERNGAVPGPARVVDVDAGLALRADVPLHDRPATAGRLRAACEAIRRWHDAAAETSQVPPETQPLSEAERELWIAAAAEFGRAIADGPGGHLAVSLPVPGRDGQARIGASNGHATVAVRVATCERHDPATLDAIGRFLLRAAGALTLVRAAVRPSAALEPAAAQIVLEVALPRLVDGVELDAALSALTVACRHCARETRALTDARLARAYLDHTMKEAPSAIR